ncbi:MAG: peptide-methionine (S)-S-oxide reductase MsrA [Pseudomonadota bacterium]|nr:peptide-methionine (S)-S-oxide reductase MsrA [Pseudomonadota bacterium]
MALAAAVALLGLAALQLPSRAAEQAVRLPPAADAAAADAGKQSPATAVFAGGCFWGIQGVFQHTKGVLSAVSGYAGGSATTAHYEIVGSGMTGHAESVKVLYDPKQVSYAQLLQIFFSVAHDPTQLNRQFPDSGTQYRSAIFTSDGAQQQAAEKYVAQLDAAKVFGSRIVTQVTPLNAFYPAEDYHQDYATLHPDSGYIATYDLPKIANLKTVFPAVYRDEPVLVSNRGIARR